MSLMEGSPLNRADLRAISVNTCRTCILLSSQPPDKLEPVLADKEIVMAALNIRSMSFGEGAAEVADKKTAGTNSVNILLDLSFVTNVRYLDQHEIHQTGNVKADQKDHLIEMHKSTREQREDEGKKFKEIEDFDEIGNSNSVHKREVKQEKDRKKAS